MATVIDALVVTLGLDPKQFKKATKDVDEALDKTGKGAKRTGDELENAAKKAAAQFSAMRNEVLRTAVALIGLSAIKSFVAGVTSADAALGRMAHGMDQSVNTLSKWKLVAEMAGVSGDEFVGNLNNIRQQLERFALTGEGGESFRWFRALGVELTDAKGKVKPLDDLLGELAGKLSKLDPAKARAIGQGLGFGTGGTDLLMRGRPQLEADAARAAQNAITPEDAQNATALNDAWKDLGATFARIGRDVLNEVSPALVGLLHFIRDNAGPASVALVGLSVAMTSLSLVRFGGMIASLGSLGGALGGALQSGGALVAILGRLGLVGAVGAGAFSVARVVSKLTGVDDLMTYVGGALYDRINGEPDMRQAPASGRPAGAPRTGPQDLGAKRSLLASLEKANGLPAGLLDSVWAQESGRGARTHNDRSGADGDFQFMPDTARTYGVDTRNFESSARGAARMYSDLLRQYGGNLPKALAGYNWGSGNLQRGGMGRLPVETRQYIAGVMNNMRAYQAGQPAAGNTTSVNVGKVEVHTAATDGKGVARDLVAALHQQMMATQANTGVY